MEEQKIKFLFLSQEDMVKAGVLNMNECVKAVEEGFVLLSDGDCLAGGPEEHDHGCRIWFPSKPRGENMPTLGPDRRFMAMVGYLGGRFNICGTKWYGSNIENRKKRNLPRSILLIILNDPVTGAPLAIMDGTLISAMRTGAVPGIAAKYLASDNSKNLGIVGGGVISRTCLMSLSLVLKNLNTIKVYDINRESGQNFCNFAKKNTNVKNVYLVDDLEELAKDSDVINVAAAGEKMPLIKNEWLREDSCLILVGGIEHQEDIYLNSNIIIDDWKMHLKWIKENEERKKIEPKDNSVDELPAIYLDRLIKEGKLDTNDIINIGDIITGKKEKNRNSIYSNSNKYLFISGGLPMEDLSWSYEIYNKALKKRIGQELTLWEKPYFL